MFTHKKVWIKYVCYSGACNKVLHSSGSSLKTSVVVFVFVKSRSKMKTTFMLFTSTTGCWEKSLSKVTRYECRNSCAVRKKEEYSCCSRCGRPSPPNSVRCSSVWLCIKGSLELNAAHCYKCWGLIEMVNFIATHYVFSYRSTELWKQITFTSFTSGRRLRNKDTIQAYWK